MATKRIAASGGHFTTLSAWLASLPTRLTEPEIAELESFDLVEQVTIGGKITTPTAYIEIRAASGHGHQGVVGAGARFRCGPSAVVPALYMTAAHIRIRGIGIYMDKAGASLEAIGIPNALAESEVMIENCIIRSVCTNTGVPAVAAGAGNVTIKNNIVVSACRSLDTRGAVSAKVFGNDLWRTADAIGFLADSRTEARNNYSGASTGSSQCYYTATGGTGSHNASADNSAIALYPTGSINNVAGTAAFTSPAMLNFTLAAGSPLIDAGIMVSGVVTDIIGRARPQGSACDIGAFELAAADAVAPTLSSPTATATSMTTAVGTVSTNEANGTLYWVATQNPTESPSALKAGASLAVDTIGTQNVSVTGLSASTGYRIHYLHRDAAGNDSTVVSSAAFTTHGTSDTTPPTLIGSITISSLTTTSYTASWPAGSDNIGVAGYEYRLNGGIWINNATSTSVNISGRTAGSSDIFELRAYDAAGNRSTPALSQSVHLLSGAAGTVTVGSAAHPIRNSANVAVNESSVRVSVMRADTMQQVYYGAGHAITAGVLEIRHAAIITGAVYHVSAKTAAGWIGLSDEVTAT